MASRQVVMVADCDHGSIDIERAVLRDVCPELAWFACRHEDEVIAQCASADALLIMYAPMTRRVLAALPRCKVIVRYGVGVDTIDLKAAAELGIVVSNVPDYGTQEVSDHALAMMLCLTRKITMASSLLKEGLWDFRLMQPVRRHQEQTIGIVGLGRIGRAMADKTRALGMKVLAYDPLVAAADLPDFITQVSLEQLLAQADVVSVHCPLNESTRMLLSGDKLRLMKPTAVLVNSARGSIVDEVVLEAMLSEGTLAGAAMDVFASEPTMPDHPLFRHENFLGSPHMAWYSDESIAELKRKAAEEVVRVLAGEAPRYQVNKFSEA